jgi:hypothetical protein
MMFRLHDVFEAVQDFFRTTPYYKDTKKNLENAEFLQILQTGVHANFKIFYHEHSQTNTNGRNTEAKVRVVRVVRG